MRKYTYSFITLLIIAIVIISQFENNKRQDYVDRMNHELAEIQAIQNKNSQIDDQEKALGQPDMAALQEYFQTMDPAEMRVPKERLIKAQKQMHVLLQEQSSKNIQNLEWENISSNMGGRTRSVMWDPNSSTGNKVWATAVTGGIWYNDDITNAVSPWHPVDDFMASLSVSNICYDPNNTNVFYAGTGEAPTAIITYRESSGRGVGILKSLDGGNSWSLLESTEDFAYITDIKVRDENGESVIYAGVASGKYMGEDHNSQPSDGLYRSTDGGVNWEQVLPNMTGLNIPNTPADIEFSADGRIFIGTMRNIDGNGGGTILYSDAGTTGSWTVNEEYKTAIEAGIGQYSLPGRVMIGPAPDNENTVYAIIGAGYENGFGYYRGNFVLISYNKGESWSELNLPGGDEQWASLSWHAFTIAVDPENEEHFYVGGLDEYHTLNEGSTYTHVSDWAAMYYGGGDQYIHADQHCIQFKPGSSDEIIFATDGGVFYTNNGSNSYPVFQERNRNYSSLMFYTCDIHPTALTNKYIGGLQDNGTLRYSGSPLDINDMFNGGDGAYCFYDKNNPSVTMASYYYNRYTIFEDGNWSGSVGDNETGTFISPADFDSDNNILYGNGIGFFGQGANKIFRATGIPNSPSSSLVSIGTNIDTWYTHVAYSPYSPSGKSTLFVGSNAGDLFKVEEAQSSSPNSTSIGSNDFPTAAISCVAIGGTEDTLLVTFSNYGVSSIWQTYNGGNSWTEVEGNLPDMPIRWAIYHPESSRMAIIATELGVWFCEDLGADDVFWQPAINGMANVRVDMLKIRPSDQKVLAATHGRGLFTTNFELAPLATDEKMVKSNLIIGPNPSNGEFFVELSDTKNITKTINITDTQGQIVFVKSYNEEKILLNLRNLSTGTYVLNIKTSNNNYSNLIIIQ
jgi:photosystem II stability/assembly factor-like uncharacterized protein